MRQTRLKQLPLVPSIEHAHAKELKKVSALLDELPDEALALVESDIRVGSCSDRGRRGMAAEQVLRALMLKQMTGLSYERLAFALLDSQTYRAFCRLGPGEAAPKKSTLKENLKRVKPETLEQVHRAMVALAFERGIEDGHRVGADSTAIETNIHHPTDSSLLYDCVHTLTRLLEQAANITEVKFSNHRKRAKRRALEIAMAKRMKERRPPYEDLLKVVGFCLGYAQQAVCVLRQVRGMSGLGARGLADELEHFIKLATKVSDQAYRRVFLQESVPAEEKVFSIYEPHTDIIVKDKRDPIYGHKAFLTIGSSGLVLDLQLPRGNPNDSTLTQPLIESLQEHHEVTPTEAAFDGGFCSHENFHALQGLGIEAVAFTSPRGLTVEQMTGTRERFQLLRRFRASLEGTIGWLKNVFGFRRCTFRGFDSFRSYAWASVLALNALLIARAS